MACSVKIIEDSISPSGVRITTLQLKYWRAIHAEFMTHRVFSRNAASSRAIPVAKMIEQVRNDPATPIHWGKNIAGMQADEELTGEALEHAKLLWREAARKAANLADDMTKVGLHKQVANRILEPFQWMHVVVTATEWSNFFALRCHPAAQPEIQELACTIRDVMAASTPVKLGVNDWHIPYVSEEERKTLKVEDLLKISTARCARVSYLKHDGTTPNIEEDFKLHDRLVGNHPIHASPAEHQAYAIEAGDNTGGNFGGWRQYRSLVERKVYVA